MTAAASSPDLALNPSAARPSALDADSLATLLKVAGIAGLAGAGLIAADRLLLSHRASHPWRPQNQDRALRPTGRAARLAARPAEPISPVQVAAPEATRSPSDAELSQPYPLPTQPGRNGSRQGSKPMPRQLKGPLEPVATARPAGQSLQSAPRQSSPRQSASRSLPTPSPPASRPAAASLPAAVPPPPPSALPVPATAPIAGSISPAAGSVAIASPTAPPPNFSKFLRPSTAAKPVVAAGSSESSASDSPASEVPAILAQVLATPITNPDLSQVAASSAQVVIQDDFLPSEPEQVDSSAAPSLSPVPLAVSSPADPSSTNASPSTTSLPTPAPAAPPAATTSAPAPASPTVETAAPAGPTTATPSAKLSRPETATAPVPVPVQPPAIPGSIDPALETAAATPKRFVETFEVTGSTVYGPEELAIAARNAVVPTKTETDTSSEIEAEATPKVDRDLSAAELVRASEAITARYVEDGYINSGAYVPEEVLSGGPAEIRVVEGRLEEINVTVEPRKTFLGRGLRPGYVERRIARATQAPLNINELVDGVRLLELDPTIERVSTELVPGTETGASSLNVTVLPAKPFAASVSVDNTRSPSVGSIQQRLDFSQANLLGVGDRLNLGVSRSSGSNSVSLGYEIPVNARNGKVSFDFSRSASRVIEAPFDELEIESKARTYELGFRQPLIQTPNEELGLSVKAFRRASEGFFLDGATPFPARGADDEGRTRITALRFGQDWTKRQPKQVILLQSEFSLGLGLFDATVNPDNNSNQPDGRFFAWRGQGQWVRRLGSDALLSVKGDAQLAANSLLSSEQFGIGGLGSVRGYRSNTLLTDSGWLASAEVQVPIVRMPKWRSTIKLAPFFEMGGGWNLGEQDQPDPSRLMSTGVGLLWDMGDRFRARLDWGFPLTSVEQDGESLQDKGINFSVLWNAF